MRAAMTSALTQVGSVVAEAFRNVPPPKKTQAALAPTGAPSQLGLAESSDDESGGSDDDESGGVGAVPFDEESDVKIVIVV